MLDKILEFLFPASSNAKNRNKIFLWFLASFVIAIIITFLNGYYLGKCDCPASNSGLARDTIQLNNLKISITRLKEDSAITKNDIDQLVKKIDYEILRNSYNPIELNNYSIDLSNLNIKNPSLQSIKLVVADIIKYKSDIISNLIDSIESQRKESNDLKALITERYRQLGKLNKKIDDKK